MLSVKLPKAVEKQLREVVQGSYQGDLSIAILAFLRLHEKYGWKEQLRDDVRSVRAEVRRKGGVKAKTIEAAIKKHRKNTRASRSLLV